MVGVVDKLWKGFKALGFVIGLASKVLFMNGQHGGSMEVVYWRCGSSCWHVGECGFH